MFLELVEGEVIVNEQGMDHPAVKKLYASDKKKGKPAFKKAMKFIYYVYHKDSIYRNYLPHKRELKVIEVMFPGAHVNEFIRDPKIKAVISAYVDANYTFKEKIYKRLLKDIEDMMEKVSKVPLTKTTRVKQARDVSFFCKECKKEITQNIEVNANLVIDNSEEKLKAMDVLEKLLNRETILKKQLKEEEQNLKIAKSAGYLFDN